ncbi:Uncharacterised protein [Mycobacterium tuberculosis]|nr:Uncharacterised protein [Mycobacterium tuberculosis]
MTLPLLGSYQQPHFSDPTLPYRVKRVVNVKKIHAMTLFYKYLGRTPLLLPFSLFAAVVIKLTMG